MGWPLPRSRSAKGSNAARGDDNVLLAVDDFDVSVAPLADVAGMQPTVDHCLARQFGVLVIAGENHAAAHQHLAVLGKADLGSLHPRTDRSELHVIRQLPGHAA